MQKLKRDERGFTLIEMLLVMVIMGIMLAVIVPRAWRANVDSKYTLVRQNCTELVAFASNWAEQSLLAQDDDCNCSMINYYLTLSGETTLDDGGCWITHTAGNWTDIGSMRRPVGRTIGGAGADPEATVSDIVDPSKLPRNPFSGASVFVAANHPPSAGVVPGAICCVGIADGTFQTFALLFQGTDSTTTTPTNAGGGTTPSTSFYAGQSGETLAGVRNGVFMARLN